jgi:hypothetical protein
MRILRDERRLVNAPTAVPTAGDVTKTTEFTAKSNHACITGSESPPLQWGSQQVLEWLEQIGLQALQTSMSVHRIYGDVLLTMNLDVVAAMLKLSASQKAVLRREIAKLRSLQSR